MRRIDAHQVLGVLGRGGMGEVLLARTRGPYGFSRLVAIKCLSAAAAAGGERAAASLVREALAYARLTHPCIVQLHEVIVHEGMPALVLEYVDGLSLKRLRRRLAERGAALSDRCALYVMSGVFSALAAAHAARDPDTGAPAAVIHRDVSPGNILVSREGDVKLADFGIARLEGVSSDSVAAFMKGTLGYMAPEQVTGGPLSPCTDVYAACLLARELLVRRPAFEGSGVALMCAMAYPRLKPIASLRPDLPRDLARLLTLGLEPVPEQRAPTARDLHALVARHVGDFAAAQDELRRTFEAPQTDAPGPAHPSSLAPTARSASSAAPCGARRKSVAWVIIAAVLALTAAAIVRMAGPRAAPPGHGARSNAVERKRDFAPAAPLHDASPEPSPAASAACTLVVSRTRIPHRIFVDAWALGQSGAHETTLRVPCGLHRVRVGSRGPLLAIVARAGEPAAVRAP